MFLTFVNQFRIVEDKTHDSYVDTFFFYPPLVRSAEGALQMHSLTESIKDSVLVAKLADASQMANVLHWPCTIYPVD